MAWRYEEMALPLIANTVMHKGFNDDGVHKTYRIAPAEGYILHDNTLDWYDTDPETMEEVLKLGFARGTKSCGANYDFIENSREFYAIPDNGDIPEDQIFGGTDHEVM